MGSKKNQNPFYKISLKILKGVITLSLLHSYFWGTCQDALGQQPRTSDMLSHRFIYPAEYLYQLNQILSPQGQAELQTFLRRSAGPQANNSSIYDSYSGARAFERWLGHVTNEGCLPQGSQGTTLIKPQYCETYMRDAVDVLIREAPTGHRSRPEVIQATQGLRNFLQQALYDDRERSHRQHPVIPSALTTTQDSTSTSSPFISCAQSTHLNTIHENELERGLCLLQSALRLTTLSGCSGSQQTQSTTSNTIQPEATQLTRALQGLRDRLSSEIFNHYQGIKPGFQNFSKTHRSVYTHLSSLDPIETSQKWNLQINSIQRELFPNRGQYARECAHRQRQPLENRQPCDVMRTLIGAQRILAPENSPLKIRQFQACIHNYRREPSDPSVIQPQPANSNNNSNGGRAAD